MTASFRGVRRDVGRASAVPCALGAAALIALATGCARQRQPQQPVGRTPTFESQTPAERGAEPPGMQGEPRGTEEAPQRGPGAGGRQPYPGQPGMQQPGGPEEREGGAMRGRTGEMSERDLCDELEENAVLRAEVIPGGVQIVATPKSEGESTKLSQIARRIQSHLSSLEGAAPPDPSSRCALFDMGRMGARGGVAEGPDAIRIIFTSEDTANVPTLRQQAQTFVQSTGDNKVR